MDKDKIIMKDERDKLEKEWEIYETQNKQLQDQFITLDN
jgi:hypothetical protein